MDWSMPTLDIFEFQGRSCETKDPQLCRQINDYNLTISWNSGFTQFYNQCFLAFLGSVKTLCKVDFDPLFTFSYFLTILTISLTISVISRARRSAHRSRSVAWNRMPKSSENGFRMLRNAWENENMRRYAQISKVIEMSQVSWNLKIVEGCVMEARGRINVDVGKGRFKLLHVTVL